MGSWNACCGISKLPILYGDKVVDFFIGEVGYMRDSGFICYSNDLCTPITIQTYGVYNDYGTIKNPSADWHVDYINDVFKKYLAEVAQGENEYHDIAVRKTDINFKFIEKAIHEGRLYLRTPSWIEVKTSLPGIRVNRMMVHRFVFDEIVSWGIDKFGNNSSLEYLIEEGIRGIEILKHSKSVSLEIDTTTNAFLHPFAFSSGGETCIPHRFKNYLDLAMKTDKSNLRQIIVEMAKFMIFSYNMAEMQILWTPHIGSQNQPSDQLSKLSRLCDEYAQKKMSNEDEFDEED